RLSVHHGVAKGIEDRIFLVLPSLRIGQHPGSESRAEIAPAVSLRRDSRRRARYRRFVPELVEIEEEECLIAAIVKLRDEHGPAHAEAVIVIPLARTNQMSVS